MTENNEIKSLADIFASDDFGLLDEDNLGNIDILGENSATLNVKKRQLQAAKEIGERFPCKDFEQFEPIFAKIQQYMAQGKFQIQKQNPITYVKKNAVFVLMGMLCFIAEIKEDKNRKNSNYKERVRLIFVNGTESDMLARSVATALSKYKDMSYHVAITAEEWLATYGTPEDDLFTTDNSQQTGTIYIARLKNYIPEFSPYHHAHKIGFTIGTADERIKNCLQDATFLYRQVEVAGEYEIRNANAQRIEAILHAFFGKQKINTKLVDKNGNYYQPSEWFNVPIEEIDKAMELIETGEISKYWFNDFNMNIELKN